MRLGKGLLQVKESKVEECIEMLRYHFDNFVILKMRGERKLNTTFLHFLKRMTVFTKILPELAGFPKQFHEMSFF